MLAEIEPVLTPIAQFGFAGFMGAMWLWERQTSRKREEQIDDAHARIVSDRVQLEQLIAVVKHNAEVMSRLSATQDSWLRELRKP